MKYKICPGCKDEKLLDEEHYHRDIGSKTGFVARCKKCVKRGRIRKRKWDNPKPKPKVCATDYNKACREDELRRYQEGSISIYQ
jgi:hypothetical protein